MKSNKIIPILSIGLIICFIISFVRIIYYTIANEYMQYKMLRLICFNFQKEINSNLYYFIFGLLIIYSIWFLFVKKIGYNENKFLKFQTLTIIALLALLSINYLLKCFSKYNLFSLFEISFFTLGEVLSGEISYLSFLRSLKKNFVSAFILIAGLVISVWITLLFLYGFLAKIKFIDLKEKIISIIMKAKYIRKTALCLMIFFIILNLSIYIDSKLNAPTSPNVILIGIDTLRADHVGCYGYYRNTTPNIDMLANQGIVFKKAFSTSSWTLPSFLSILTSLYQISHGVSNDEYKLDYSFITFAELLKNKGYKTAGFISGPYLKRFFGFDQGFDLYNESACSSGSKSYKDITSDKLNRLILPWLHKNKNKKFFLFLHYWDPHFDFIPPSPYDMIFDPNYNGNIDGTNFSRSDKINPKMNKRDLEHIISLYDGEILWTDMHIGKLFSALKKSGLFTNTIIVIVGDHGEEFFEHGGKGHRRTLYNEVIDVPLILKIPRINKFLNVETSVSIVDILPTILDILNIKNPASMDGMSLIPVIYGEKRNPKEVYSELHSDLTSMISEHWKLIHNSVSQEFLLYDIKNDQLEKDNMIDIKTMEGDKMKEKMFNWLMTMKETKGGNTSRAKIDQETMEQLRSLGYINYD